MSTRESIIWQERCESIYVERRFRVVRESGLHLVSTEEKRALEDALLKGHLPLDFERKLCRLGEGNLTQRYVAQSCRLVVALLFDNVHGLFTNVSPAEFGRLLLMLAYVRKDEDAVPDYRCDGYKDDAQEMRILEAELAPVLRRYKQWRLRHQVPGLWLRGETQFRKPSAAAC